MLERFREAVRRRPLLGVGISIALHVALLLALVGIHPTGAPKQKKGDALIVELPNLDEPASAGTPGPQAAAPPVPAAPAPPSRPTPPAPPARPTPPVPARPPVAAPPAPAPKSAPRAVASAQQPPAVSERGDMPAAKAAPSESAKPETATQETPAPPAAASAPSPPQVAMVPPPAPDIRSAFRRGGGGGGIGAGGAGGTGIGRGGIVGEPVALDSKDPDLNDYLQRIKRLIQQNWVFPCVKDRETGVCEYKSTELLVEFGILKGGPLQYIEVRRASPYGIYDEFAVNAVKLASPFPPVPPAMMARMARGSTGAAVVARFVYHIDTGITNVLR